MFCVLCKEGREICVYGEFDNGVFFFFGVVVMGMVFDFVGRFVSCEMRCCVGIR